MAKCPQCGKYYDDAMSFCLDDGSYLLADRQAASEMPTDEYRSALTESDRETETVIGKPVPTIGSVQAGPRLLPVLVIVGLVIGGIVLLAAVGFAGLWYYASTAPDDRTVGTSNPPTDIKKSPTPLDTLGAPDPVKTDDDSYPDNKVKKDPRTVDVRTGRPVNENTTVPPFPRERPDKSVEQKSIPKQISAGVLNGKAMSLPKPPYPPAARAVRASGAVIVQVLVDESGNVVSANAVSGHPLLRPAAAQAARNAKFTPTKLAGQPVKVSGVITYNFVAP